MENVFIKARKRKSAAVNSKDSEEARPEIKDLAKEYLNDISKFNQAQKVSLIFKNISKKKPDVNLNTDQILNRILYRMKFGKYIKDTDKFLNKKKKKFKWPRKWKKIFKLSRKKKNQILVWFLNIKGEIEMPKLYPIYSSNMVIIQNRPYEVHPRSFWRMGKYTCQIIKGIDRRPVSNLDYDEIRRRGDATDSDEFLIKASHLAFIGGIKKKPIDRRVIIIGAIIAFAVLIYFMSGA